jgi:hypothetical protein
MIKLVCTNCNKAWYTANTSWSGSCESCNGQLREEDVFLSEDCNSDINKSQAAKREIASSKEIEA